MGNFRGITLENGVYSFEIVETTYSILESVLDELLEQAKPAAKRGIVGCVKRMKQESGTGAKNTKEDRVEAAKPENYVLEVLVNLLSETEAAERKPSKTMYEEEAENRFKRMSRAYADGDTKAQARWRELGGPDKRSGAEFQKFRRDYIEGMAETLEDANWKPKTDY